MAATSDAPRGCESGDPGTGIAAVSEPPAVSLGRTKRDLAGEHEEMLRSCKPHHRAALQYALIDVYGQRNEARLRLPRACEEWLMRLVLADGRDLPILYVFIEVSVWLSILITLELAMLPPEIFCRRTFIALLVHFAVIWLMYGERYILAMHYSAHRSLFSPKLGFVARVLNNVPQMVLSNFYGMPCGAYYLHHCIMHHQSNNLFPYDLSSTTPYQRDSPLAFLHYLANFVLHTILYLPYYAARKGRCGIALGSIACSIVYVVAFQWLFTLRPAVFFVSLGFPSAFGPILLMFGNFGQHMFIDPAKPESNYGLSVNLLAAPFNMTSFNDGYHIVHHLNSVLHWSEMPLHFMRNIDKYEAEGALLFQGINFMEMGILAHTGQLRQLAKHVVQLKAEPLSTDELVELLKQRLAPLPKAARQLSLSQKGVFGANQLIWLSLWMAGVKVAAAPALSMPFFAALSFVLA